MKRVHEMTEDELLGLSGEEVQRHIDYECALEGVSLLPPSPGPEPTKPEVNFDITIYKIGGLIFTAPEVASSILALITSAQVFTSEGWGNDRRIKLCRPDDYHYPKIETEKCLSAEAYDAVRNTLKEYEGAKRIWDAKNKEYASALNDRSEISERIYSAISDAQTRDFERKMMRQEFARYLDLAEGNATVAMNFLLKAKSTWGLDYPEVVQDLCPGYGTQGAA